MSIIFKYVFRQAIGALLLILLSLAGIVWIALALKQLNVVTSQGQDAWLLLKMTTLALPKLLVVIAPFALLVATFHTLNRLNGDSELIVLTASGATIWVVARPLLILGLIVSAFVAYVNHVGMPWSLRQLQHYVVQMRTDLLTQVIQPGRFSSPEKRLTFHIRERTVNGELLGLIMHDSRNKRQQQSYLAERGQIVKQDASAYLIMESGHILQRSDPKGPARVVVFDKYIIDLNRFDEKKSDIVDYKPRERYLHELINPEPGSIRYRDNPGQFRAELHERFSGPLYPIAFVFIALAAIGQAQSTRQNRMEHVWLGFIAAIGLRLGGFAVNNLVSLKAAYIPLMYAVPLAAILLSLLVIKRDARPRAGGTPLSERLGDLLRPLTKRLRGRKSRDLAPVGR